MNVYTVRSDGFRLQELDLEIDDFIDQLPDDIAIHDFSKNNMSFLAHWKLLRTGFSRIESQENLAPDITKWIDATLLLSPKAYRYLGEFLSKFGEFLPIIIEDQTYHIFNCLTHGDADENLSDSKTLKFDAPKIADKVIFKTPHQSCLDVYCTGRLKDLIESFNLKGVLFDKRLMSEFSD